MSIKKLFGSTKVLSPKNSQQAFEEIESSRNLVAIKEKQATHVPQVDYTKPNTFAKFGSAYLYYNSSVERIIDYYPYDGSDAEINEFYNKSLDIERYIFDNLYPRTNGYALLSADGWGTKTGDLGWGYGYPASEEYIEFKGGPGTGSGDTLAALSPDPMSSKFQYSNIYDTDLYRNAGLPSSYASGSRESNLKSDFEQGVTVEFWLKKAAFANTTTQTQKEVIFDLWNNNVVGEHDYGRITIFLSGTVGSTATPFYVTVQSGTTNIYDQAVGTNTTLTSIQDWNHYAISLQNSGSDFDVKLYLNGHLDDIEKVSSKNFNELDQKDLMGRIGSLITASQPSPSSVIYPQAGNIASGGKLSGSIDEFRFWKIARTGREIGLNWFTQVRGGVNTDISNTTLGMYYKFNEGIAGDTTLDNAVLDYGGRICNGVWVGYDTYSRNTGSAMIESGHAAVEYLDPIVYSAHPDVSTLKTNLRNSGSYHDRQNNSNILSMLPSWIIEEDENNSETDPWFSDLRKMTHIVGTYFDKLHSQISELPKIKNANYVSSSYKPLPFARHLPQSLGLNTPEIFVDSEITERFLNKALTSSFGGDLSETKNLIYINLYNNLTNIFKTKGTERAIKNVFRCFYMNDSIISLKTNAKNTEYTLSNKLKQTLVETTEINFNNQYNTDGVIYQAVSGAVSISPNEQRGYISGSLGEGKTETDNAIQPLFDGYGYEDRYGFTAEADIVFPKYYRNIGKVDRSFISASLFGMYTVNTGSAKSLTGEDTVWIGNYSSAPGPDTSNFQVHTVREARHSKGVYFRITSSNHPYPFPELTSSVFKDTYGDTRWNVSVRLEPKGYPYTGFVSGSSFGPSLDYKLIFRGINTQLNEVVNSFTLTASITGSGLGINFVTGSKRLYAGAERTNITGTLLNYSDVRINGLRYWGKSLSDDELLFHAKDYNNIGVSGAYENAAALDKVNVQYNPTNQNYLFLNWNFENVTASAHDGQFYIDDVSTGSIEIRNNYGWLGKIGGYQHTGYGYGFGATSADAVVKQNSNTFEFVDPEQAVSSDMIKILSDDDKVFGVVEEQPSFHITLEKSLYGAVTKQMLDFFAGAIDFHNAVGHPVHRYRSRYKDLEKLREIFFRKVTDVQEVEKFLDYYRWFDESLTAIISQLVPGSSRFSEDILNVIESHVLERNKYQSQFPTIEFIETDLDQAIAGAELSSYPWPKGHSPIPSSPRSTSINAFFWRQRARADSAELTSGDTTLDEQRQRLKDIIWSTPTLSQSLPVFYTSEGTSYQIKTYARRNFSRLMKISADKPVFSSSINSIKGGVNFNQNKNIDFTYNALRPAGPIDTTDGIFVPENVLVGWTSEMEDLPETHLDDLATPEQKTKRYFRVDKGRDWVERSYENTETSFAFPFNLMSSSVKSGYNKYVVEQIGAGLEITNLHNDTYGSLMELPMQGPFTNYAVGGHQSRHIKLNTGSDDYTNRPEAWKLLLGDYTDYPVVDPAYSGSVGMASADYPWPEANEPDVAPYPMTASHKAWLYRDFVAKRPVNIKNIEYNTGSMGGTVTVLGNYQKNYQVLSTFGAYATPRSFINYQPSLPSEIIWDGPSSSIGTNVRSIFDIHRDDDSHFQLVSEYDVGYLLSGSTNKTVIINRFGAPGGIETQTYGYQDFKSSEYSTYNSLNYRNLTVIKPSQGSLGTTSEATGSTTTGIRVSDVCIDPATGVGKDFGLRSHLARHSAKFGRNASFITGTTSKIDGPATTAGGPGASTDQFPSMFKNQRNVKYVLDISNDGDLFTAPTLTVVTKSLHDNYFIGHQIPRSDRQYSWIGNGIISSSQFRYYGYAPLYGSNVGLHSSSTGYVAYYDGAWVSASSVVSELTRSFYQPTERLNLLTLDSLTGSGENNVLGFSFDAPNTSYINNDILGEMQMGGFISGSTDYLNLLLTRRKDVFGWNWRKMHPSHHPIIADEHEKNQISVLNSDRTITKYNLPPVSFRGRPAKINFNINGENMTLQVTHNNEKIYFNDIDLNNRTMIDLANISTPLDYISTIAKNNNRYDLLWIMYSENIFPSARREMVSSSRSRTDYDNKFWRDSLAKRGDVGNADASSSFGVGRSISQSCWILDPQQDFLTRTLPPAAHVTALDALISSGGAGELQNNYFHFHNGVLNGSVAAVRNLVPAALYARKHGLSSPHSVVAPTGPRISATGTLKPYGPVTPFSSAVQIDYPAGEALWEAGTDAGVLEKSGSTIIFVSKSSEPWFDEYNDFKFELNKVFKDYAIVPEFRISEHVQDYVELGLNNKGKQNTFEIPGTNINSITQSFYKDYSNSEFLHDFLNIKEDTLLQPHEIRLTVSAAIRFNPYKGFYPAQRTIDIVSQFSKSYGNGLVGAATAGGTTYPYSGKNLVDSYGGLLRPLMQVLYSPGILFNSIKAGMAVDYPIVTDPLKLSASYYGADTHLNTPGNWMMSAVSGTFQISRKAATGYQGGEFFDMRVPFEAILKPDKYLGKARPIDMESHLSASIYATASCGNASDETYSMMVSNFLGEVGNFFLKDSNYTQLKSGIMADDLRFKPGSTYGARIKLRRSVTGPRTYQDESGSMANNTGYGVFGGQLYSASAFQKAEFPLPQDPRQNEDGFKETFTIYSRPTAFGPPISGRPAEGSSGGKYPLNTAPMDSINGFNWAYTPPYTNGEAWCDVIFRPSHTRSYDLETILSEINMVYWRADPGYVTASTAPNSHGPILISSLPYAVDPQSKTRPYTGYNINSNAMQLSASLNLLGIERVLTQRKDRFGNSEMVENTTAGKRWVIQPKFETPMMNFADNTIRAVDPTLPVFASASVPRGMWHQFGLLPADPSTGIFMEIEDIPVETLKYHYDIVNNDTVYNNSDAVDTGLTLHKKMQSLTDLMGFDSKDTTKRLGELRENLIVREAIVAVPYIIESVDQAKEEKCGEFATTRKRFFTIPKQRVSAAKDDVVGSAASDSLLAAGESIRKMIQKMQRYVLPPQFDFINNPNVDPLVMYIFEFEFEFDKDDLSYMWQNLAPRDYKKITKQHQSIAHRLDTNELLSADNLSENENMRWMVFKIKQRSQAHYSDLITSQLGGSAKDLFIFDDASSGYEVSYNWPYDYLSFVELIKIDAEVLYKDPEHVTTERVPTSRSPSVDDSPAITSNTDSTRKNSGQNTNNSRTKNQRTKKSTSSMSINKQSKKGGSNY